jgi:hypothetical protein
VTDAATVAVKVVIIGIQASSRRSPKWGSSRMDICMTMISGVNNYNPHTTEVAKSDQVGTYQPVLDVSNVSEAS